MGGRTPSPPPSPDMKEIEDFRLVIFSFKSSDDQAGGRKICNLKSRI
jgi:hypothetical protein